MGFWGVGRVAYVLPVSTLTWQSDFAYLSFFIFLSNVKLVIFNILKGDFFPPSIILEVKSMKSLTCILGVFPEFQTKVQESY